MVNRSVPIISRSYSTCQSKGISFPPKETSCIQTVLIQNCFESSEFWVIQPSVTQKRGKKKVFSTWFNHILYPLSNHGIPSGKLTWLWKITIFNGKFHYKWLFSIAMLNYQRVSPPRRDRNDRNRGACAWAAHRCARRARRRRQPCTRGTLNCRLTWRRWLRSAVKALGGPKG